MIKTAPAIIESPEPREIAPFDYSAIEAGQAKRAKAAAAYIGERHRGATAAMLEIGRKLIEVKADLEHGQFERWLDAEFGWSDRSARNYMLAARTLGEKSETVSVLPVNTIYALARASEPVREKVVKQIEAAALPAETVMGLLAEAKDEEKAALAEARKSPEQKAKDKAKRARELRDREQWRKENDERRALEDAANSRVAVMIVDRFGDDLPALIAEVEKARLSFSSLAHLLRYPYGMEIVNGVAVAKPAPGKAS